MGATPKSAAGRAGKRGRRGDDDDSDTMDGSSWQHENNADRMDDGAAGGAVQPLAAAIASTFQFSFGSKAFTCGLSPSAPPAGSAAPAVSSPFTLGATTAGDTGSTTEDAERERPTNFPRLHTCAGDGAAATPGPAVAGAPVSSVASPVAGTGIVVQDADVYRCCLPEPGSDGVPCIVHVRGVVAPCRAFGQ